MHLLRRLPLFLMFLSYSVANGELIFDSANKDKAKSVVASFTKHHAETFLKALQIPGVTRVEINKIFESKDGNPVANFTLTVWSENRGISFSSSDLDLLANDFTAKLSLPTLEETQRLKEAAMLLGASFDFSQFGTAGNDNNPQVFTLTWKDVNPGAETIKMQISLHRHSYGDAVVMLESLAATKDALQKLLGDLAQVVAGVADAKYDAALRYTLLIGNDGSLELTTKEWDSHTDGWNKRFGFHTKDLWNRRFGFHTKDLVQASRSAGLTKVGDLGTLNSSENFVADLTASLVELKKK